MDVCRDWTKVTAPGNIVKLLEVLTALNDAEWTQFADAIKQSKTLESLTFSNGPMSSEAVRKLSQVLAVNKALQRLNLRGTGQTSETVRVIIDAISENAQSNAFAEAIAAALEGAPPSASPCGIDALDLSSNVIGDEGVIALAPLLKKTHIRSLNLASCVLTTEGFKRLFADMPKGIQGTTIRSQKVITKIPFALDTLDLSSNAPGLEGVKAMSDFLSLNTTITSLSLRNCQLGDHSVQFISKSLGSSSLSRLSSLDLAQNQVGADGANHLISLLSVNHLLVKLDISDNPIPDDKRLQIEKLTTYNQKLVDSRQIAPWKSEASIAILSEDGTTVGVTCATVLSNGLVIIGSSYGDVYIWNPAGDEGSSKSIPSIPRVITTSLSSNDPSFLKQGKIETKIVTYEPDSRPTKRRINALIDNLDGTIWCVSDERSITIIGIAERTVLKRLPLHKYQAIAIAKNGLDIYLGGATGEISLWRSDSMACRHEIVLDGRYPISSIYSDGEFIYVGVLVHPSRAGHVLIFSQTMELIQHFEAHSEFVSSIVTLNGKIITCSWDSTIKIWNVQREGGGDRATQAASSSSSPAAATAQQPPSGAISAISLEDTLDTHHARVTSLVLSNNRLISCSDDNTLIVWDISKEKGRMMEKRMLGAWGGAIYSLQASHDKVVSCSHKEGRVTLWSLS